MLIHFFSHAGDTLGGHLDDMEADWSKPIVSMRYLSMPLSYLKKKKKKRAKTMLGPDSSFTFPQFGLQSYFPFGRKV